jgi:VWFA-related protein
MRSTVVLLLLACAVAVVSAAQHSQPPARPQFRSAVEVVEVDVSVLDDKRRPVRGLTASDFTVVENGRPQELVSFAAIDVAPAETLAPGWLRDIAPDVRSNLAAADRLIVLVLDDAQTRFGPQHTKAIKDMARGVINRLGRNDLACVVFTRDNSDAQPFTNERQRLLTAVDGFHGNFGGTGGQTGADRFSVAYWYMSSLKTLRYVAESLSDAAQRRKVVIYLSPGVPIEGSDLDAFSRRQETQRLIEEARRANVTIYGLDPSGLGGLMSEDATGGLGSVQRQANDFLESIAGSTGGRALINRNDFVNGVNEVFDENASYYLLGFRSNDPGGAGFRRIDVRVNKPGVTVRARNGYVRAKQKASDRNTGLSDALVRAMRDAAPKADIAMQMTAAPFALTNTKGATVAVAVALRQPRLAVGGSHADYVNLIVGAYEPDGKRAASERLNARVAIREGGDDPFLRYELLTGLQLPPGRYQLRVAAESALHAKEGSIHYDLDVPDFTKGDLHVSGVLLSVEPNVAVAGKDRLSAVVPVVPTSRREFWDLDRVTLFARVYRHVKSIDPVTMKVQVRDAHDRSVFERTDSSVANLLGSSRVVDYGIALPIASLTPGPYLVTIEASTNRETARRDVRFVRR